MGAYYGYQVVNKENKISYDSFDLKEKLELENFGGLKFLESCYNTNPITQALYFIMKKIGKPVVVNTICDYDEDGTFKEQLKWGSGFEKTSFDIKELGKFLRAKEKIEEEHNLLPSSLLGYIVCDSKKQYFNIYKFTRGLDNVVSPLALLTRSTENSQGGGDFDVSDVDWEEVKKSKYKEFKENLNFDKSLISSWKDLEIQFYEDNFYNNSEELEVKLKEYEDISEKIFLERGW